MKRGEIEYRCHSCAYPVDALLDAGRDQCPECGVTISRASCDGVRVLCSGDYVSVVIASLLGTALLSAIEFLFTAPLMHSKMGPFMLFNSMGGIGLAAVVIWVLCGSLLVVRLTSAHRGWMWTRGSVVGVWGAGVVVGMVVFVIVGVMMAVLGLHS